MEKNNFLTKDFLEHQRKRIRARIAKYHDPKRIGDELLSGDVSPYTRYKQKTLIPILEKILRKIDSGEYGICEDCGNVIEKKRLAIVPAAEKCSKCMNSKEK